MTDCLAVHSPSYWELDPEKQWSFSVLAALARLGHKYELSQIFHLAMKRLKTDMYTDDYDSWHVLEWDHT